MQTQNQENKNDWPKEPRKEMPSVSDLDYHWGSALSVSADVLIHTYSSLFPSNKHFTSFIIFCVCGYSFLQSQRAMALSPANDLVARIQCSHLSGTTTLECCFKPPKTKATQDHLHPNVDHLYFFFHETLSDLLCLAVFLFLIDLKLSLDPFIIVLCIMDTLKFFFHLFLLVGG